MTIRREWRIRGDTLWTHAGTSTRILCSDAKKRSSGSVRVAGTVCLEAYANPTLRDLQMVYKPLIQSFLMNKHFILLGAPIGNEECLVVGCIHKSNAAAVAARTNCLLLERSLFA
jgi:hypothetical protein